MKYPQILLIGISLLWSVSPSIALGRKVAPQLTPAQQALQADLIVVGKIIEIEEDDAEATVYQGATQKTAYKIANVKIHEALVGAKGVTHIRVGFIPTNQPDYQQQQFKFNARNINLPDSYTINDEGCFFLQKHHDGDFYVQVQFGNRLDGKMEKYDLELEKIKKFLSVFQKPMGALKAKDAGDRQFAACALLTKYRSTPRIVQGVLKEVEIPKEESKLILDTLSEMEWGVTDPWGMSFKEYGISSLPTHRMVQCHRMAVGMI